MTQLTPIGMDNIGIQHVYEPGDVVGNTTNASSVAMQKASGTGGLSDAVAGTDYSIPSIPSMSAATRTISGTGFQISTTRGCNMYYTVQIVTTASIGSGATGYVVLETSPNNSAWTEAGRIVNGQVITLAIALNSVQTTAGQISGYLPAGYYARLRSVNTTGTPTYSYISGQEVLL